MAVRHFALWGGRTTWTQIGTAEDRMYVRRADFYAAKARAMRQMVATYKTMKVIGDEAAVVFIKLARTFEVWNESLRESSQLAIERWNETQERGAWRG